MLRNAERVTQFHEGTPAELQRILESLRQNPRRPRVRVFLGDQETGWDWSEENNVTGSIGRSTGEKPILLLIPNSRSLGGEGLLTDCIVKLVDIGTGRVLYRHPNYHCDEFAAVNGSDIAGYGARVFRQDHAHKKPAELYARCRDYAQAVRLAAFMDGSRHCK